MGFFKSLGLKKKPRASATPSVLSSSIQSDSSTTSSLSSTPKSLRTIVAASGPLMPSPYLRGSSFDHKPEEGESFEKTNLAESRVQISFNESLSSEKQFKKEDSNVENGTVPSSRTSFKGRISGLLSGNSHQDKNIPARSNSLNVEKSHRHRKNPSLETILRNMYSGDPASGAKPADQNSIPNAMVIPKEITPRPNGTRSGTLVPREITPDVETLKVTKSRSGVLSPRDWQDGSGRGPRSGQLNPVEFDDDSSTTKSSSRASRLSLAATREALLSDSATSVPPVAQGGGSGTLQPQDWSSGNSNAPVAERGGSGTLQAKDWSATTPVEQVSEGILQTGRSRSGQLTPSSRESGYGFGLDKVVKGPRSMMSSRGSRDVYQGERQQKGAAQRRLNRNRHSTSEDPIPRGALARGRLDTWQEVIAEGDENGSGTMQPKVNSGAKSAMLTASYRTDLSRGATGAKSRLQQSETLFSSSRNPRKASDGPPGPDSQSPSERMAASLVQAQKIVRGSRSGQLAPSNVPLVSLASSRSRQDGPVDNVLNRPFSNVREKFQLQMEEIGRGRFGVIRVCLDRKTGEKLACKSISKARLKTWEDAEDVRREIMILELLQGHPHVVSLKGCFEDALNVHLVMELCEGGELFDRIMAKKRYSEPEAALVCRTVIGVLRYIHALGYIHRDLKPENVLLCSKDSDTNVKVIDFGVATAFTPGIPCREEVGTPFYLAPEVLSGSYGPEADIWSSGVILYILLCGVPPFWANDTDGIKAAILSGKLDLQSGPWRSISAEAKDLVRHMLKLDVDKRIRGDQILAHPWIQKLGRV